jgi:hypothetical protein
MAGLQNLSGTLANNNAWRHRVAGCDARHNGTVSDTQVVDPIDLERAVHHRHRILSLRWGVWVGSGPTVIVQPRSPPATGRVTPVM